MKVLPAIDILDGSCVRLNKGEYSQVTKYCDNPLSIAKQGISTASASQIAFEQGSLIDADKNKWDFFKY